MRKKSGRPAFNGLHLRLEADAAAWIKLVGGEEFFWKSYFDAMTNATFDADTPLVRFENAQQCTLIMLCRIPRLSCVCVCVVSVLVTVPAPVPVPIPS